VTDQELREMIRESIVRHVGGGPSGRGVSIAGPAAHIGPHPSHLMLPLMRGGDDDGACLIEPAVRCSHCGYCLSYGH